MTRARFSAVPPHSSVAAVGVGGEEAAEKVAVGGMDLDAVEPGFDRPPGGRTKSLDERRGFPPGTSPGA